MSGPCRPDVSKFVALIEGNLSPKEVKELKDHVQNCPDCGYKRLEQIRFLCKKLGKAEPPSVAYRLVEAQTRWHLGKKLNPSQQQKPIVWEKTRSSKWQISKGHFFAAAAALAVITFGIVVWDKIEKPTVPKMRPIVVRTLPRQPDAAMPAHELAAMITIAQGDVNIAGPDGSVLSLDFHRPLVQGDRLLTETGEVAFQWEEGSGAAIASESEIELKQLTSREQRFVLWQGRILSQVSRLADGVNYSVEANGIQASVKGTRFLVAIDSDHTIVEVYEGVVVVQPVNSATWSIDVPAGYRTKVAPSKSVPEVYPMQATPHLALLNLQPWSTVHRVMTSTGSLEVNSSPPGADLGFDGIPMGHTNLTLRTSFGRHLIELRREGKLLQREWVNVTPTNGQIALNLRQRGRSKSPRLQDGIYQVFVQRAGEIRWCYERRLKSDPELAGKFELQITIDETGTVSDVKIKRNTLSDPSVAKCASAAVKDWLFPAGNSAEIVYPFVFRPH
ncbi:MAG: AgmX/PglI C-terminal domain-containing protein [Pseudomonadota bacterium]